MTKALRSALSAAVASGAGSSSYRAPVLPLQLISVACLTNLSHNFPHRSLRSDLHVVVLGDPFVGLVHPCKIYNILTVAAPVLYIGPRPSHLSETLGSLDGRYYSASVAHGEVSAVQEIQRFRERCENSHRQTPPAVREFFSKKRSFQNSWLLWSSFSDNTLPN